MNNENPYGPPDAEELAPLFGAKRPPAPWRDVKDAPVNKYVLGCNPGDIIPRVVIQDDRGRWKECGQSEYLGGNGYPEPALWTFLPKPPSRT